MTKSVALVALPFFVASVYLTREIRRMSKPDEDKVVAKVEAVAPSKRPNILDSEWFGVAPGDTDPINLLLSRAVQKEIALTDEQAMRIDGFLRQHNKDMNEILLHLATCGVPSHEPGFLTRWYARISSANAEREQAIKPFLNPSQIERLKQIAIQNAGPFAFLRPEVADALVLTLDQRKSIADTLSTLSRREADRHAGGAPIVAIPPPVPGVVESKEVQEYRHKLEQSEKAHRAMVKDAYATIDAVLTPPQKARFDRLCGLPFEIEPYRGTDADIDPPVLPVLVVPVAPVKGDKVPPAPPSAVP